MALNGNRAGRINLKTDIRGIVLDVNRAIPCGLIINELFSNVLKHAFSDGKEGSVTVSMYNDNDGKTTLSVSDDGIGFPESVDFRNTKSLGLQLVISLVQQLDGTIEMKTRRGNCLRDLFSANKTKRWRLIMANEKILIVEDEGIVALSIKRHIEKFGFTVADIATSGDDAITRAMELRPDLVLMDIALKGGH